MDKAPEDQRKPRPAESPAHGGLDIEDTVVIPRGPGVAEFVLDRDWRGRVARALNPTPRVRLSTTRSGLRLEARFPRLEPTRVPEAPARSRVDRLWEFDVIEVFLVGADRAYLEVEVGPAGHFLALGFDAPRRLTESHRDLEPRFEDEALESVKENLVVLELPGAILPAALTAVGVFAILGGEHRSWHGLPGDVADFHQPATFPLARWQT